MYDLLMRKTFRQLQNEFTSEGLHWENIDLSSQDDSALSQLESYILRLDRSDGENDIRKGSKNKNETIKNRENQSGECRRFEARHFFGAVEYDIHGFREKNMWTVPYDYLKLFSSSDLALVRILFPEIEQIVDKSPKLKKKPLSVATQAKIALESILQTVENATCAHVLCLKPNNAYKAAYFDDDYVEEQLKYYNILETVQLFSNGFCESQSYEDCLKQYKMLSQETWPQCHDSSRQGVVNIVKSADLCAQHLAYGREKIFFKRLEMIAHLEEQRQIDLHRLATVIQKAYRSWVIKRENKNATRSQMLIAARFRAFKSKREHEARKRGALIIAVYYRRWKVRRAFRLKRERAAGQKILRFIMLSCKKLYLIRLMHNLPSLSPICQTWPNHLSPSFCKEADQLIKFHYHRWRCRKYRLLIDQQTYFRLREKVAASIIFSGKKAGYTLTVAHSFRGDYVRIRQNPRWKKSATDTNDEYVVFADIANKIHRTTGKISSILLVLSTNGVSILDNRTLTVKHRTSVMDIERISLSPFADPVAVFHTKNTFLSRKPGDFLFECRHMVELVAKLYLVIQNASGKTPSIIIAPEIAFGVEGEKMQLVFNKKTEEDAISEDAASGNVGCFSTSPSLTMRPTTPTPVANSNKTPPIFSKSADDTHLDSMRSPQIHRLKLSRKGARLDIYV